MGVHKLMVSAVVLVCFCSHTPFAQINKNLVPDESKPATGGGTRMVNESKYTTALARGGSGVHPTGDGGNGNGGQSTSSPQEGGKGGAGGQLRNHKGGASTYTTPCLKTRFIATTLASLLLDILM